MSTSPLIIVGNPRSGTTLLRLMLTCHPNICVPPEGPFLYMLEPVYGSLKRYDDAVINRFVADVLHVPKMEEWDLDSHSLTKRLKDGCHASFRYLVDGVYREYMAKRGKGKGRWGDKSGSYTIAGLSTIRRVFPNAFIIHLVRDGRDVACSYRSLEGLEGKYAPHLPTHVMEIAYKWQQNVERIDDFLKAWPAKQQALVHYEDLVSDPESVLHSLCNSLDEKFDTSMVEFHQQNAEFSLEPKVYLAWKQKTLEAVSPSQVGRWRKELTESEVAHFEALAGHALCRYGYQTQSLHDNLEYKRFWLLLKANIFRLRKEIRQQGAYMYRHFISRKS